MASIGNVGSSSLIKSANGIANQINDYKDKMAALQWNSSAQNDADWQAYSNYLQDRIGTLSSSGSLSSASKALTLSGSLQSANRSYTSNIIQRASTAILEGNGTATDKQSAIVGQYEQALANGDDNLAQNLRQQYDSLNQQIQYDAKTAATASDALAKTNAIAQRQGYTDAASAIKSELQLLNKGFSESGQAPLSGELHLASDKIRGVVDAMNKSLPADQQITIPNDNNLNNGSLIQGAINAIGTLYGLASDVAAATPGSTHEANDLAQQASNFFNGISSINVLGHDFNIEQANEYARNPSSFITVNNDKGTYLVPAAVTGISYDQNGNLVKNYSSSVDTTIGNKAVGNTDLANMNSQGQAVSKQNRDKTQKELEQLGFNVDTIDPATGEIRVSLTDNANNKWITSAVKQYGLNNNATYKLVKTGDGYQILQPNNQPIVSSTGANLLLSIHRDDNGRYALASDQFNKLTGGVNSLILQKDTGFTGTTRSGSIPIAQVKTQTTPLSITTARPNTNVTVAPTPPPSTPLTVSSAKPTPSVSVGKAPATGGLNVVSAGTGTDKSSVLTSLFSNFGSQAKGYTESSILPSYAKQFYGGDVKAASADVYNYRKANFNQ